MTAKRTVAALVGGRLRPIGVIRSALKARREAPKQGSEGAPDAWLDVQPWAAEAMKGLTAGDEIIVITWFHRARRDLFQVHPRSDVRNPLTGVFATRSPDRPNPLGLHPVVVRAIAGRCLRSDPSKPSTARRSSTSSRCSSDRALRPRGVVSYAYLAWLT
jgi:tRNA-Thr(GGU) m(6)t(6)A37 methyltransferase TsaA